MGTDCLTASNTLSQTCVLVAEIAQRYTKWKKIVFLQSPPDREVALAFGITDELFALELEGKRSRCFDFLTELSLTQLVRTKQLAIFFSGEWDKKDRVRYSSGTIDALIYLLSTPGH